MNKRHLDIQTRHSEGTGGWLIETPEFKNWFAYQGEDGCRALLGFGDPGTGKTFLCYFAIEYLRSKLSRHRAALGHVYLDFRDEDNQNACAVIGELAKQLLLQVPSVPNEVWEFFDKSSIISMDKAQRIFTLMLRSFDSIYICIDGLDECEPQSRTDLLGFFNTLSNSSLSIFCTGRFSVKDEAMKHLRSFNTETLEIVAHEMDIRRYIEVKIAQDRYEEAMDDQLREEIINQLVSRSQKLFILPAFQLQYILEHVTKRNRRDALKKIPDELFKMYDITFERIQQQPVARVKMAIDILSWIYLAPTKLDIAQLQHALAVQPKDDKFHADGIPSEKALLDCCLGLVVIEQETSTIRLTHFTLQEYLDKHWRQLFPFGHSRIASTCLTYLKFEHPISSRLSDRPLLFFYVVDHVAHHLRSEPNLELDNQMLELIANKEKVGLLGKNLSLLRQFNHPLHWAAYLGIESLSKLIMAKTDQAIINVRTENQMTALSIAAQCGHEAVVRLLLDTEGVEVDPRDDEGMTPLSHAASWGEGAVIKLLLSTEGVEVDSRCNSGRTPLSYAAESSPETVVGLLVGTAGVELDSRDEFGRTPLSYAAQQGKEEVVKLLLSIAGVEADSRDNEGLTPLSYAIIPSFWEKTNAVARLLLDREDVNVNSRDKLGLTPLSYAVKSGDEETVKLLIDAGGVECDPETAPQSRSGVLNIPRFR